MAGGTLCSSAASLVREVDKAPGDNDVPKQYNVRKREVQNERYESVLCVCRGKSRRNCVLMWNMYVLMSVCVCVCVCLGGVGPSSCRRS